MNIYIVGKYKNRNLQLVYLGDLEGVSAIFFLKNNNKDVSKDVRC